MRRETRYIRIELDGDKSYLRYTRGMIQALAPITHADSGRRPYWSSPLSHAMTLLRREIKNQRDGLRAGDSLAERSTGHVFTLLRRKRREKGRIALSSKGPLNRARHVGIEIEFACSDERSEIATTLAQYGVERYCHLKDDASVRGDGGDSGDCNGSCRDDCNCFYCDETHYCDDSRECARRSRNQGDGDCWKVRDNCEDCTELETRDDCGCGLMGPDGEAVCDGHVICVGHCTGHSCDGYDDHSNWDCNCECTCSGGGHELAVVCKSTEMPSVIKRVCQALADHGAKVNETCGLHVHLDMRGVKDVDQAFGNLVKSQRLLYSMCPQSRYDNGYCRPNRSVHRSHHTGRYWGINPDAYHAHETLEVRIHSGTVNAEKIIHWVTLLQKIGYGKRIKRVACLSDLTGVLRLPEPLVTYIRDRVKKFSLQHGEYSLPIETDAHQSVRESCERIAMACA